MKRLFLLFIIAVMYNCILLADFRPIVIQNGGAAHDHFDQPILFDQPDVYLDDDNLEIIIDGDGAVSYYDVEIESMTTWLTVISTQVSGTYDTIDVSSLAPGDYIITITSPTGHEFEGFFEIE